MKLIIKKEKLLGFIPPHSLILIFAVIVAHCFTYFGTKLINGSMAARSIELGFESSIPFQPDWVIIYVLSFFFWMAGLVYSAVQEEELAYKSITGVMLGELICAAFFIAMPTAIVRPEITGELYYDKLLEYVYAHDAPSNLFPSMHCMMSYMVVRILMNNPKVKPVFVVGAGILTLLICASTLFVKQHFFLDVVFGLLFAELSMFVGFKTRLWTLFSSINKKILALAPGL